jgi:tryptophanyl-tRNA synthetase
MCVFAILGTSRVTSSSLAFDPDQAAVAKLKERYRAGGLGDVVVKRRLVEVLDVMLAPIRVKRRQLVADAAVIGESITAGTSVARARAAETLDDVRQVFGLRRRAI